MKLLSIFGGFPVVFLPRGLSGSPHLSQFFSCGTSTICSHTAMEASFLISHLCHFNCLELFQGLLYPFPRQLNSYPGPTLHAALLHLHSGHSLPTTKLQLQSPPRFLQAFAPAPGNSAYLICCCCCSVTKSCPILQPHGLQHTRPPFITISWGLLKLMSIESMIPSIHLILCHPLLLLLSIFPSINVFSNASVLHIRWPQYWSFKFSISPSNEYSGLISFRMDWLDLLAVQEIFKSLL